MRHRLTDARTALRTIPEWPVWRRCLAVYGLFLLCAVPLASASGILRVKAAALSPIAGAALTATIAIYPAFGEELIFRVLLLPRRPSRRTFPRDLATAIAALMLYLVSHPLNAWLFREQVWVLFTSPGYLTCVALLGAACTAMYWLSGSIWPPVVFHWLTAGAWILYLGGQYFVGS